jgi:serine/threonine protein phosphatase PrpC
VTLRHPGDFLLLGSDGIFDRIPDAADFARHLVDAARDHFGGDLKRTVAEVIRQFSAARGADGSPVCDDNMSLVITAPDNCDPRDWAKKSASLGATHA